jgi:hypothetical protein
VPEQLHECRRGERRRANRSQHRLEFDFVIADDVEGSQQCCGRRPRRGVAERQARTRQARERAAGTLDVARFRFVAADAQIDDEQRRSGQRRARLFDVRGPEQADRFAERERPGAERVAYDASPIICARTRRRSNLPVSL